MNFELSLTFVLKHIKYWKMIIVKIQDSLFRIWFLDPVSNILVKNSEGKKEIKNYQSHSRLFFFFEPNKTGQPLIYSESLRSLTSRPVLRFPFLLSPRKKCSLVASKPFLTFLFSCLFLFSLQAFFFLLCEKLSTYCSSLLTQSYWVEILYKVAFIQKSVGGAWTLLIYFEKYRYGVV